MSMGRNELVTEKQNAEIRARALARRANTLSAEDAEREKLSTQAFQAHAESIHLEALLQEQYLPAHGAGQLISPRAFFMSPLFRVCDKRIQRVAYTTVDLKSPSGQTLFAYEGPELRQSDGLVFACLLNLAREHRVGDIVRFSAQEVCRMVFDRYDGPTRKLLVEHVQRLQRGLVKFQNFSVQLCLRFNHPSKGDWSIQLDEDIVRLFSASPHVWLNLQRRKALSEGLTTWLYAFVEAQSKLIPTKAVDLKTLCGSEASDESFVRMLRASLGQLAHHSVIDNGWYMKHGVVYWRKA